MIENKDFENLRAIDTVDVKCDYCYVKFNRKKHALVRGRSIIEKDSCSNKKCISLKRQESNVKKYGVSNPTQNKDIRKKQVETLKQRYGVTVPAKSDIIIKKIADTNLKKYGNKCSLHNEVVKEKAVETWKNKYGCDHPFASPVIRKKIKDSMYEKYGDHYTKTEDYLNKTKETCQKKYGVDHHSQTDSVKEKRKKTNMARYGCEHVMQNIEIKNKLFKSNKKVKIYGKAQKEVKDYLKNITGLDFESFGLNGKEIDIYNNQLKIGIEYCGLWWHNEKSPEPRMKKYHWNKYNICLSNNIRLITIFEDEWLLEKEKCKNYIKSILGFYEKRLYARKCKILEISNIESNKFYSDYHLFDKPYNTKKSFGLFYDNELIGAMSLGIHHRCSSKITINRLCFKPNLQIIGGVSKLFSVCKKWCEENYYKEIVTWSDNRWSSGKTYEKIGFILDEKLGPDYSYVNLKKKSKRLSKQSQKKDNSKCPKGITELEWAEQNNLARIWDCGKKRWIFKL